MGTTIIELSGSVECFGGPFVCVKRPEDVTKVAWLDAPADEETCLLSSRQLVAATPQS